MTDPKTSKEDNLLFLFSNFENALKILLISFWPKYIDPPSQIKKVGRSLLNPFAGFNKTSSISWVIKSIGTNFTFSLEEILKILYG